MTREKLVDNILSRGVIKNVLPSMDDFRKRLLSEKPMKFYIGADPTGPSLHLSHAKNFMLLEEFRQLGHQVFVLFGDFTACIGDPTDRNSTRAKLSREDAKNNADSWVKAIAPIINFEDKTNPAKVVMNSTWFDKMSPTDMIELLSQATVQQMLERDMFQKRIENDKPIHLHELVYPLFQGMDSVHLDVDAEVCGTDQTFNALVGRDLIKRHAGKEKFVVAVNLMENPETGTLMSKSNGTGVFLGTDAQTMFGEIMSQPDEMIRVLLTNNTRVPMTEIDALDIENKPMDAKRFTATQITQMFYGKEEAKAAQEHFTQTFSKRAFPEDAPSISLTSKTEATVLDILHACDTGKSNSELRRLIAQSAVSINGEKQTDATTTIMLDHRLELKIGKRGFYLYEPAN